MDVEFSDVHRDRVGLVEKRRLCADLGAARRRRDDRIRSAPVGRVVIVVVRGVVIAIADQLGVPAGTPKRSQSWILVRAATSLCVTGSCGVSGARHTNSTVPAARKPGRTNPSLLVLFGTVTVTSRSVPNKIGVRERT